MKRFLFFAIMFCFSMSGCDDYDNSVVSSGQANIDNAWSEDGIIYPFSEHFAAYMRSNPGTRSGSSGFETDWENTEYITTATGLALQTPWTAVIHDATVPVGYLTDVRKSDGWILLLHTFNNIQAANYERNYIVFYNIRTGIMKVLNYLERSIAHNNCATWEITFDDVQTKYFHFAGPLAHPISLPEQANKLTTSVVSTSEQRSFAPGWNCFVFEMAYDGNADMASDLWINFTPTINNKSFIELGTNFSAYSEGKIISYSYSNPVNNLVAKATEWAGGEAKTFLENQLKSKTGIVGTITDLAKSAVTSGLNKLFFSFTGRYGSTSSTSQDIYFTTSGTAATTGEIIFSAVADMRSLKFNLKTALPWGIWEHGIWRIFLK